MKVAAVIGQDFAPGSSGQNLVTPIPGAFAQSALAAAAWKADMTGSTALPSLLIILAFGQLVLLGVGVFDVADRALRLATLLATPSLPLAPMPTGHSTADSSPTFVFQSSETLER